MTKNSFHAYDVLGNIALVKFSRETKLKDKKQFANKILKDNKSIKTVLEKTKKFKGRLRKQETKHIAGEKTKEVLYKENNCIFRFNLDCCYFSPRLSNERKEIASKIKKDDEVLVMFAGVAPFPIVIAKNSKATVYSNEINREANKYTKLNIELNKLKDRVFLLPGDVKKVAKKIATYSRSQINNNLMKKHKSTTQNSDFSLINKKFRATLERGKSPNKFDVIVMPRPKLKDTFLKQAFSLSKKNTRIFYYDFCKVDEKNQILEKIKSEAKKAKKKIKILQTKTAGEIAPYEIRIRVDFKVL